MSDGLSNWAVGRATAASTRSAAATLARLPTLLAGAVVFVLFAAVLGAMAYRIGQYLVEAWCAVNFSFSLDIVEGAVWQQATLIPGPKMYGPIDVPPFSFFEYPPGYHIAVKGLAALGGDFLKVGRALSVACTLIIAG